MKSITSLLLAFLLCATARAEYTSPDGLLVLKNTSGWTELDDIVNPGEYGFINEDKSVVFRLSLAGTGQPEEALQQFIEGEQFQQSMKSGFAGDDGVADLKTEYVTMFKRKAFAIFANLDEGDEPMLESTGGKEYGVAYVLAVGDTLTLLGLVSTKPDPQQLPEVKALLDGLVIDGVSYE